MLDEIRILFDKDLYNLKAGTILLSLEIIIFYVFNTKRKFAINIESCLHEWKILILKVRGEKINLPKMNRGNDESTNWSDANSCFFVINAVLCLINIQKGNGHQIGIFGSSRII